MKRVTEGEAVTKTNRGGSTQKILTGGNGNGEDDVRQEGAVDEGPGDGLKELRKRLLLESRNEVGDVKSNNRHEVRHQHQHGVTGGADAAHAGGEEHEAKQRDFSSVHSLGELGPLG